YYRDLIPITEDRIEVLEEKLAKIYIQIETLAKPINEARNEFNKQREVLRKAYLLQNRNRLNKTIRDYTNGKDIYMPTITTNDEKELWNNAMEIQLANKTDMDDMNDELLFELWDKIMEKLKNWINTHKRDYKREDAMKAFRELDVSMYGLTDIENPPVVYKKYSYNEKYWE
ncbi:hypothetical protein LCGC14_2981010, partial [marine sediment metagenome]